MRKIKFRAKRVDNGEWIYGDLLENIDCYKIREKEKNIKHIANSYIVETRTIGQYAGLVDIDGKEIYEGDIVQDMRIYANEYKNYGDTTVVKFCPKDVVKFCTEDVASCGCCYDYFIGSGFKANLVDLTCCKIIGNIYDNPELLKKESK